ncbi:MAG: fer [Frankiales bacterium]|nr:fer [Frankiales bacterium]
MTGAAAGRLSIVPGRCIGAGNCVDVAESHFDQSDEDATVILLDDTVEQADLQRIRRAVYACPVAAILLQE